MRGFRQRRLLVILFTVGVMLTLGWLTARDRPEVSLVERRLRDAMAPLQFATSQGLNRLGAGWRSVAAIRRAQEENRDLKRRLARLTTENASLHEAARENSRWRKLFDFLKTEPYQMLPAQVIGRDPTNWFSYLLLDKGSIDGLAKNMPVLTDQGVVGVVRQITPHTASVLLLLDTKSAIGGQVTDTRDYVLVEGSADLPGRAVVKPLAPEVRLHRGQIVITSGLGELFPKGLSLGRIERVVKGKFGLAPYGILRPAVDFSRLEEVAIMLRASAPPVGQWGEGAAGAP